MSKMQGDNGVYMEGSKETTRKVKVAPARVVTPSYVPPIPKVPLRCLIGGAGNIIKDNGPVTGQEYVFRPGQVTYVDYRDQPGLLARRTNPKSCCGGQSPPTPQPIYGTA